MDTGPFFNASLKVEASVHQDSEFAWCIPTSVALVPKGSPAS